MVLAQPTTPTVIHHGAVPPGSPAASAGIPAGTGTTGILSSLSGSQRDAYTAVQQMLDQYGLSSLAPTIINYVQQGYNSDTINYLIQETPEWQKRFAGNVARQKAGLPVLSPANYLSVEDSYRQIMQQAGMPPGFWDQPSDFVNLIGNDVSPAEVQTRVKIAQNAINSTDPGFLNYFKQYYGSGDLLATVLDPTKATDVIQRNFQSAQVGGAAADQGINISQQQAGSLVDMGVSQNNAMAGFSQIAAEQPIDSKLSSIYGQPQLTTQDLINETFKGDATVTAQKAKLASAERGQFSGRSGAAVGSIAAPSSGI